MDDRLLIVVSALELKGNKNANVRRTKRPILVLHVTWRRVRPSNKVDGGFIVVLTFYQYDSLLGRF